jgi:phosphoglycerate kinase
MHLFQSSKLLRRMEKSSAPLIGDVPKSDLFEKRVIARAGFDVPVENGVVVNDFRIREALPTIKYLVDAGAKVILISHIGRDKENTLRPVADALRAFVPVTFVPDLTGQEAKDAVLNLENGTCLMLENLRGDEREVANDEGFARELSAFGDMYIDEAFSVMHRSHASIVGIPKYIPSYVGIESAREITELTHARTPEAPSLFILGGSKFDTKIALIESFIPRYSTIFVGGALAHDIWRARGISIGTSVTSDIDLKGRPFLDNPALLVPVDVVVQNAQGDVRTTTPTDVREDEAIMDCGPETVALIARLAKDAKTVLWNGPLGWYEKGFIQGTQQVVEAIAHSSAYSIVGGGDTVAAIESTNLRSKIGFVSTGGGAMLELLLDGTLPGISVLSKNDGKE